MLFKTKEAFDKAIGMNKQKMGARYLDIQPSAGKSGSQGPQDNQSIAESMPEDCKTLFVKNLPYEFKEDDIGDRFRPFGEIAEIRVGYNWQTK